MSGNHLGELQALCDDGREESLALLKELIACETTDTNEDNGQRVLERRLERLPCEIHRVRPDPERLAQQYPGVFNPGHSYETRSNLVAVFRGSGGGRSLVLNGHMDTVSPGPLEKWSSPPFAPRLAEGRLFGMGSADMKAGLVGMLRAVELLSQSGFRPRGDIIYQSVVDEEAGGGNGTLACIDAGYTADAALIGEPTRLQLMSAQIGSVALRFDFVGKASHSNLKWEGVNAFEKALPFLNRLRALEGKWQREYTNDLLPAPIISINTVRAGDGGIITPPHCQVEINYTYHPGPAMANCRQEILEALAQAVAEDLWLQQHAVTVTQIHDCPPYYQSVDGPWPAQAQQLAQEVLQTGQPVSGIPCGSDARLFANVAGMPVVLLGPGDIRNAHSPDEYVPVEEYHAAIRYYVALIQHWVG